MLESIDPFLGLAMVGIEIFDFSVISLHISVMTLEMVGQVLEVC